MNVDPLTILALLLNAVMNMTISAAPASWLHNRIPAEAPADVASFMEPALVPQRETG